MPPEIEESGLESQSALLIVHSGLRLVINVPEPELPIAEAIKELFLEHITDSATTPIELHAAFLSFVHSLYIEAAASTEQTSLSGIDAPSILSFTLLAFHAFHEQFVAPWSNIHLAVTSLAPSPRSAILRTYYSVLENLYSLECISSDDRCRFMAANSAILDAAASGSVKLFPIFGGQGNVEEYFAELVAVHQTYDAFTRPFLSRAALTLAKHSGSAEAQAQYATPINVLAWLDAPESRP
eukprot:jgi/Hompol1/6023/HPOL_002349-RA